MACMWLGLEGPLIECNRDALMLGLVTMLCNETAIYGRSIPEYWMMEQKMTCSGGGSLDGSRALPWSLSPPPPPDVCRPSTLPTPHPTPASRGSSGADSPLGPYFSRCRRTCSELSPQLSRTPKRRSTSSADKVCAFSMPARGVVPSALGSAAAASSWL